MMVAETLEQKHGAKGLARVFKALGDENRLAIFQLLREPAGGGSGAQKEGAADSDPAGAQGLDEPGGEVPGEPDQGQAHRK